MTFSGVLGKPPLPLLEEPLPEDELLALLLDDELVVVPDELAELDEAEELDDVEELDEAGAVVDPVVPGMADVPLPVPGVSPPPPQPASATASAMDNRRSTSNCRT